MGRNSIPSVSMEISVSLTLSWTKMGEMFLAVTRNSSIASMAHENEFEIRYLQRNLKKKEKKDLIPLHNLSNVSW